MSLTAEERAFFTSRGDWREIKPPTDVDSLGKLNEWLADCGMPQRGCTKEEIGTPTCTAAEVWALGVEFPVADREFANLSHRQLIKFVAGGFYSRMSRMGSQRLVWRIRPEVDEQPIYKYLKPDGTEGDPDTDDTADLEMVDTGQRVAKCYARFWLEPEVFR